MNYDELIKSDKLIEYGIIKGNNNVLYIKVGNGGSIYGYNNKYIEIAKNANSKIGCTVIVASNSIEMKELDNIENDMQFIRNYMKNNIKKIYAFGHSNGGVILSNNSYKYNLIENILIINAPLNINWHRVKEGLTNSTANITCLCGTKDPSYRYIDLLKSINNIKVLEIENADHNFSKHYDIFKDACLNYLFIEKD